MPELFVPDAADRETLGAFVARAVRLDGQTAVRLRQRGDGVVEAWTATPFECLATRAVAGDVTPGDVTVSGNELLAALTVAGAPRMDPGPARDLLWHGELPPRGPWPLVDELPAHVVAELADRGVTLARDNAGPHGNPCGVADGPGGAHRQRWRAGGQGPDALPVRLVRHGFRGLGRRG